MNDRINPSNAESALEVDERNPVLDAFADRLKSLRAQRGLTRKGLANIGQVSERYLGNLETGRGNPTVLVLHDLAKALRCSVAELVGDVTTQSPEWLLIRELLEGRSEEDLHRARVSIGDALKVTGRRDRTSRQIALVGLRGAGKSTLGHMLAESLDLPFVELSRQIERVAGLSIREIQDLYGPTAYRRYEQRALEETLQLYPEMILGTPGGLVSEPATFNMLLSHCFTVWLKATPEDHMNRVVQQGDFRPMAGHIEAMDDLKRILASRAAFYGKADLSIDTSEQPLDATFELVRQAVLLGFQLPGGK